jgi:prephenate dehydrogenase
VIERLCIIGTGLIGGSLARALRLAGQCREVVGCSRNPEHLQQAVDLGVIDRFDTDPGQAVAGADMVLVAVPLGAMESVFSALRGHMDAAAVVTDVGSAKAGVIEAARRGFGELPGNFVPGHPIAGTEQSGVAASFAGLFQDRRVILTPLEQTSVAATARVRAMARLGDSDEIFRYAAGGFRDFTRIASSDPVMWRDICLANGDAILRMIDRFSGDLELLADAVRRHDGERLQAVFSSAKQARDRFVDKHS